MSIKLGLHIKLTLIAWGVLSFISINGSWEIKKTISIIFLHLVQQNSVIVRGRLHAELTLKNSSITFSKTWKSRIRTACVIVRDGINYHPIKGTAVFNKRCRCLFQKMRVISINTKESNRMNVLNLENPRWERTKTSYGLSPARKLILAKAPIDGNVSLSSGFIWSNFCLFNQFICKNSNPGLTFARFDMKNN